MQKGAQTRKTNNAWHWLKDILMILQDIKRKLDASV